MCGILGFNWEDEPLVKRLASWLEHRGPEQEGYHVGAGVSLGHKRLCILDLSEKGRQPLTNEDGHVVVTFNGEIYNCRELQAELEREGHRFVSQTDTEVLVHGYEQWGTELPERLNGQFAFCILDQQSRALFLARDRLGIKPLYIAQQGDRFVFGSELKVLMHSGLDKQIDELALRHYLLFGYAPTQRSILAGVQPLEPGTWLTYDLEKKAIQDQRRYWRLQFAPDPSITEAAACTDIVNRLHRSVEQRLLADVPVGAFLSGGVDSSIIVALMRDHVTDLKTFSIQFDVPEYNESAYAKIVSDQFHTDHHEIAFDANTVGTLIEELPYFYDEPFGDPSMIPTCLVSRVAREHVTVSLSGTGGDELFAGYPRYRELSLLRRLNHLPGLLRGALDLGVGAANMLLRRDKLNKLRVFLQQRYEPWQLYLMLFSYMFRNPGDEVAALGRFPELAQRFAYDDDLTNALNFDTQEYLPGCLLVKEDRASMAVTLEARVPFLDHTLVEYAATLPNRLKIRGKEKKYILKRAFADRLPHEILYRRKRGFGVPLKHYFRGALKPMAERYVFCDRSYAYYEKAVLQDLWGRHQNGLADYSRLFWSLMMFNLWFERWMD